MPANYQEPIEKKDLDVEKKFHEVKPGEKAGAEQEIAAPEKESSSETGAEKEPGASEVQEEKVTEKIETARRTTDRDQRAALYGEMQRRVVTDAPWVIVASWRQSAVSRARVRGLRLQPSFFLRLADVYKATE